jgi:hypothetical protein
VAKASLDSVGFMRGLKPPPPSESNFSAAYKISIDFTAFSDTLRQAQGRLKVVPWHKTRFINKFLVIDCAI